MMGRGSCIPYLVLCAWCSLDASLLLGVSGQSVSLSETQMDDPVEGDSVQLRCDASGLQERNVIEWIRRANSDVSIAKDGMSLNTTKYSLIPLVEQITSRAELLIILDVNKHDTGNYTCRVKSSNEDSAMTLTTSDDYLLSVLYFPASTYPICFPDGSFSVQEGAIVNMNCTTETGNPGVRIDLSAYGVTLLEWTHMTVEDETSASFELQVSAADSNSSYQCRISSESFPGLERLCTIGPITVVPITAPSTTIRSSTTLQTTAHEITGSEMNMPQMTPDSTIMETEDTSLNSATAETSKTTSPVAGTAGVAGRGGFILLVILMTITVCVCTL